MDWGNQRGAAAMSGAQRLVGQRRSGFTLFEAVVALLIVGIVSVATLGSVGTQLRVTDQSRHVTEASVLAEERITQARTLSANDLQSLPADVASGRFPAPFNTYTWRMTSAPTRGVDSVSDVIVSVGWSDGSYTLASRVYSGVPRRSDEEIMSDLFGGSGSGGGGGSGGFVISFGGGSGGGGGIVFGGAGGGDGDGSDAGGNDGR